MGNAKPAATIKQADDLYTIGAQLDDGGFGTVYKAERINPSISPQPMHVVVKVPQAHVLGDPKLSKTVRPRGADNRQHSSSERRSNNRLLGVRRWRDGHRPGEVRGARALHEYVAARPDETASLFLQALYGLSAFHVSSSGPSSRSSPIRLSPPPSHSAAAPRPQALLPTRGALLRRHRFRADRRGVHGPGAPRPSGASRSMVSVRRSKPARRSGIRAGGLGPRRGSCSWRRRASRGRPRVARRRREKRADSLRPVRPRRQV